MGPHLPAMPVGVGRKACKTARKSRKRKFKTRPPYIPKPCMVCTATSGWTCSNCKQGICHSCAHDVTVWRVFDPDTDLGESSSRPSRGLCPACRERLHCDHEPAKLWVSQCHGCAKPFSAAKKEDAELLLEEHVRDECPRSTFAPCDVPRDELFRHLEHCAKPDCMRMKKWISVARRLTNDQAFQQSEVAVLEHEVWDLRRKVQALKNTLADLAGGTGPASSEDDVGVSDI